MQISSRVASQLGGDEGPGAISGGSFAMCVRDGQSNTRANSLNRPTSISKFCGINVLLCV